MARTVGWLGRLDPITRSVANSVPSHYDRADLAALFDLKERSMFSLLAGLPKVHVGRSVLVERSALLAFLERLQAAEDPAAELARLRTDVPANPRRKLRQFRRTEVTASLLEELPNTVHLAPGELRVQFASLEELAYALTAPSEVLRDDLEAFALRYEPSREFSAEERAKRQAEQEEAAWYREWHPSIQPRGGSIG
jgi:hypothetical protein